MEYQQTAGEEKEWGKVCWTRRNVKKSARQTLKRNYWQCLIVCVILFFFLGDFTQSFQRNIRSGLLEGAPAGGVQTVTNSEIVNSVLNNIIGTATDYTRPPIRQNGVLASLFNNVTLSGTFIFGILNSLNQSIFGDRIMSGIIILLGALIMFFFWLFGENVLRVGECRFFLDCQCGFETSINRLIYVYKIRRTKKIAKTMFLKALYIFLWCFTIAGGFIKGYAYRMVPFIACENPDMPRKEMFKLSARMMKGQKWKAFVLDLTMIPWKLISFFTLGLIGIFFTNPYVAATDAQLYLTLKDSVDYPVVQFDYDIYEKREWITADFHRDYSVKTLILFFFMFSMCGWLWEVGMHLLSTGNFVNRGTLYGPWLPIYGFGGVLMLLALRKTVDNPLLTFLLAMGVSGAMEYATSVILELLFGKRWWDYSDIFLNINGRVCLEGLLAFGIGGCVCIYFLAPVLDDMLSKIPKKLLMLLSVLLIVCFVSDIVYSLYNPNVGKGITVDVYASDFPQ